MWKVCFVKDLKIYETVNKGVYHFSVDKVLDDRKSYQMDYANSDEALRKIMYHLEEGADKGYFIFLKP